MVCTYNGILLSHIKDEIVPFAGIWMDLETVKKSEVSQKGTFKKSEASQKEKNKYHILTHICGIWKNSADEPLCRAGIETQT